MEKEILDKLQRQEEKIDQMYRSVEKLRRYFLWMIILAVVTLVLPMIAMVFILPWAISTITSAYGGLGL